MVKLVGLVYVLMRGVASLNRCPGVRMLPSLTNGDGELLAQLGLRLGRSLVVRVTHFNGTFRARNRQCRRPSNPCLLKRSFGFRDGAGAMVLWRPRAEDWGILG